MTTIARWTLARFLVESHRYVRPMPWWRFLPAALAKWPAFNRQQKRDAVEIADADARWSKGFELLPEVPESSYPPDAVPLPVLYTDEPTGGTT